MKQFRSFISSYIITELKKIQTWNVKIFQTPTYKLEELHRYRSLDMNHALVLFEQPGKRSPGDLF